MQRKQRWIANCCSDEDETRRGFHSEAGALAFVKDRLCPGCLEKLEKGFEDIDDRKGGIFHREIPNVFYTSCGAEWDVRQATRETILSKPSRFARKATLLGKKILKNKNRI